MGRSFGTDEHYLTRSIEEHRKMYEKAYPNLRIFETNPKLEELEKKYEEQAKEILKLKENNIELKTLLEKTEEEHAISYLEKFTERKKSDS
jgi:hypothetical protein